MQIWKAVCAFLRLLSGWPWCWTINDIFATLHLQTGIVFQTVIANVRIYSVSAISSKSAYFSCMGKHGWSFPPSGRTTLRWRVFILLRLKAFYPATIKLWLLLRPASVCAQAGKRTQVHKDSNMQMHMFMQIQNQKPYCTLTICRLLLLFVEIIK